MSMNELEEKLVMCLAMVYGAADWKRIQTKSAYDYFNNKLKVASNESNFRRFLEVLSRKMGRQSINMDVDLVKSLEEHQDIVLDMVREETVYWGLLAANKSKELKGGK